jgi:hypothetical protein
VHTPASCLRAYTHRHDASNLILWDGLPLLAQCLQVARSQQYELSSYAAAAHTLTLMMSAAFVLSLADHRSSTPGTA